MKVPKRPKVSKAPTAPIYPSPFFRGRPGGGLFRKHDASLGQGEPHGRSCHFRPQAAARTDPARAPLLGAGPGLSRRWPALAATGTHRPLCPGLVCKSRKLVVEIDGDTHCSDAGVAHDAQRMAYLVGRSYRVLRSPMLMSSSAARVCLFR